MVVIITGASHTGKTLLAQKLLEKYKYPYLSVDHLKMGLVRSGNTTLTPLSDDAALTAYLWPIVCEIIKTAIENKQNLTVEGCYIPTDWEKSFSSQYLSEIRFICLSMSENYVRRHFDTIVQYENIIESRLCSDCTQEQLLSENAKYYAFAENKNVRFILIDRAYDVDINL